MSATHDNQQSQLTKAPPSSIRTIQEVIFHTASFLKKEVTVGGTVTVLDYELGRMDVSNNGAKLIVRVLNPSLFGGCTPKLDIGDKVVVTGTLRKEQRRTFLEASHIVKT